MTGDRSTIEDFFGSYRAAFEAFDASAIADLFFYPCQIMSDAGEISVAAVASREAWMPQLERLVAAYRGIGVRSAEALEVHVSELTPGLAQATVHWGLVGRAGRQIYDFDASYTLVDPGQGMLIAALAHNESPRLRAAVENARRRRR